MRRKWAGGGAGAEGGAAAEGEARGKGEGGRGRGEEEEQPNVSSKGRWRIKKRQFELSFMVQKSCRLGADHVESGAWCLKTTTSYSLPSLA